MDVDGTFITSEVIELLARRAGSEEEVRQVTARAMRGELDFAESLRERVATLVGLPASVLGDVLEELHVSPGVPALTGFLRERGWPLCLVSGGFSQVVDPLAARWGVARARANTLEIDDSGRLTGRVRGAVVDRAAKADALREWADAEDVPMELTVAIGDGANDLDMLRAAGLGIAYEPKPVLAAAADHVVTGSLERVVELLEPTRAH